MKRIVFPLIVLFWAVTACNLSTSPTPPPREQAPAPTEAAPGQPKGQEPVPSVPPSTQAPVSQSPNEGAPAEGGGVDASQLTETDTDILGIYKNDPKVYNSVISSGARVVNLDPMETFFVLWVPDDYEDMATRRVMVVVHGHTGSAYFQVANELEFAQKYGYAIVAIQWWTGEEEKMYSGEQVYAFMNVALQYMADKYNAQVDKCAYRGWSQGSGISYEVTYLDKINGTNYLKLIISHDGGMMPDPSQMSVGREFVTNLYNGVYGQDAFEGAHFYLYAGEPEQAEYMHNTAEVIPNYGGVVERLVEDIGAGHGGFFAHPEYHEEALEIFFRLAP